MLIGPSQQKIVSILSDGKPYSQRDLAKNTRLGSRVVECALKRLWMRGIILRTEKPIRKHQEVFRGRAGYGRNLRSYHLYVSAPKDTNSIVLTGTRFLKCENKLPKNAQPRKSKAQLVLDFLRDNNGWILETSFGVGLHNAKTAFKVGPRSTPFRYGTHRDPNHFRLESN